MPDSAASDMAASFITKTNWSWIWDEGVWLPEGHTWNQLDAIPGHPRAADLLWCLPFASVLTLVRWLVERLVFVPIAVKHGLKDKNVVFQPNCHLEKAYQEKSVNLAQVQKLASALQWTENKVRKWFYRRRQLYKPNKFQKFKECGWRATFYASIFIYGLFCLWDKPWLWSPRKGFTGGFSSVSTFRRRSPDSSVSNTHVPLQPEMWWYYMVEFSFYLSLMMSQFHDVKRKDFWQMIIHHLCTLIVMGGSWIINGVRIGSLVLLCHDAADIPLEIAKLLRYLGKRPLCDVVFVIFVLVWFPTRLLIYPFILIRISLEESPIHMGPFPCYILNAMLVMLFLLHILWSWMILRIVSNAFFKGELEDVRSDSEDSDTEKTKSD